MNLGARWHQARIGYNKGTLTTTYKVYSSTPHPLFTWRPNDPNQQTFRILTDYCWSMDGALLRIITFSLPPSSHQIPVSPHFMVHGRKASPDRPDLPPSLSPLFVILFLYLERQPPPPPPSPSRARSVCPSVDLGAHSLHHSFTSTRETIHTERPRGRLLRPPSSTDSCMHNKAGPPKPNRRLLHTALPMTATATAT